MSFSHHLTWPYYIIFYCRHVFQLPSLHWRAHHETATIRVSDGLIPLGIPWLCPFKARVGP